jgi:hypothetical protein
MEPLSGRAEHISARTAAVISINTTVIMYEDLNDNEMLGGSTDIDFTISLRGPQPAVQGRRRFCCSNFNTRVILYGLKGKPDASDEIQRNEISCKALDEMPVAMQLLVQGSIRTRAICKIS